MDAIECGARFLSQERYYVGTDFLSDDSLSRTYGQCWDDYSNDEIWL